MSTERYRRLESIWAAGGVVILDGGVGSELQRVGFPRDRNVGERWGTVALLEAPDLAKEVHRRYVRAGADVITTHTWRIDGLGTGAELRATARQAVELAREAAEELARPETAVAFSVWPEPLEAAFTAALAEAILEARPDLILAETVETIPVDLRFSGVRAAPRYRAASLGLLSLDCGRPTGPASPGHPAARGRAAGRGRCRSRARGCGARGARRVGGAPQLPPARARRVGCSRSLRGSTLLPLGIYPNVGMYRDPGWSFDDGVTPTDYAADAVRWRDIEGAQIVGGCCGTTPEHIAAVVEAMRGS